ncbi:MAG: hypothetical protein JWQ62_60 [Lacunisphaera sp.]|nr:hypothetical protein [Lacunisphaera sp.]
MKTPRILLLLTTWLLMTANLPAQSTTPTAPAQPPAPRPLPLESRQFDFWLGEWDVTTPDGKPAGSSRIEPVSNGAALLENWTGYPVPGGGNGKSLNAYNQGRKQWQQYWVGSGGGVLELSGGIIGGNMVLTGEHEARGQHLTEKITWTPNADGSVRQHWQQSTDGGKTWTEAFDGLYRKKRNG